MRNERRILLNTTVLTAGDGLGQLANLILIVSFARTFGASIMGYYSVGMSVGAIAALFVSLGVQGLLIRDISRDPECARDRIGVLLPVQLLLAPLAWLIACVAGVALIGDRGALSVVMAAAGYQVLAPLCTLLLVPLQARELMLLSSGSTLLHRLLILALGLFAIWRKASAGVVASTFIVGAVFLMVVAWRQTARRFGTPRLRFAPTEALSLYRRAAPFFGLSALSVIYARGAAIALGALSVARAVGLYAVADRLMVAFGMVSGSFNSAVYPALTRVAHQAPAEARVLLARCLRLLLVAAIPVAALAAIFATDIVRLCFGPSYAGGGRALAVLAWTLPIRGAQALLGSQLAAMNQQAALARARAVGLALFAVAAPLLIWRLSYVGAAWAVLLCDSVQTVLYWLLLKRIAAAPALAPSVLGPAAAAAVTMAASVLFGPLPLMLRVVAAVVVMAAGLWGFGAIKLHDLRFLRALIVGRSRSAPI